MFPRIEQILVEARIEQLRGRPRRHGPRLPRKN